MNKTIIAIVSTLLLAQAAYAENVCKIDDPEDAVRCKKGETILFEGGAFVGFGNPVEFAALYCDLSKNVYWHAQKITCVAAGKKKIVDRTEEDSDKKDD